MNPTRKQKYYWGRLAEEVGCIICLKFHNTKNTYVSIHHCEGRKNHDFCLPLCAEHHQTGGEGVAVHPFKKQWEEKYGSQELLKIMCDKILDGKESF